MHYPDRVTVCVSTQAGCAMACQFCATGQAGFQRHLTAGRDRRTGRRRHARGAATAAVQRGLHGDGGAAGQLRPRLDAPSSGCTARWGCPPGTSRSPRSGSCPGIRRLAAETLPVNLAVSLHAANDELRDELVPINRRYPLAELAAACAEYVAASGRRLSIEWALIDGVNDRPQDVAELAGFARPLGAHVNLIPLNPTPGYPVVGSSPARVRGFRDELTARRRQRDDPGHPGRRHRRRLRAAGGGGGRRSPRARSRSGWPAAPPVARTCPWRRRRGRASCAPRCSGSCSSTAGSCPGAPGAQPARLRPGPRDERRPAPAEGGPLVPRSPRRR